MLFLDVFGDGIDPTDAEPGSSEIESCGRPRVVKGLGFRIMADVRMCMAVSRILRVGVLCHSLIELGSASLREN